MKHPHIHPDELQSHADEPTGELKKLGVIGWLSILGMVILIAVLGNSVIWAGV